MPRALVIKPDGSAAVREVPNDDLHAVVGGWLEAIQGNIGGWHAYVDEEGKLKRRPINDVATLLAVRLGWMGIRSGDFLVGTAVFLGDAGDLEGDVPEFVLEAASPLVAGRNIPTEE